MKSNLSNLYRKKNDNEFTYENKGDVVFEMIGIVFFVHDKWNGKCVLFMSAVDGETVLSGDYAQRGVINPNKL
jgi:hypothetical protein